MSRCKVCGGKIIRKSVWKKFADGTKNFYPSARVCEKCGRIMSL